MYARQKIGQSKKIVVLRALPFVVYLDDFIAFPGFPGFAEPTPNTRFFPSFLNPAQELSLDLAIQMQDAGHMSNSLVSLLGARANVGFPRQGEQLEFPLWAADWKGLQQIKEKFRLYKHYVCIHPGARNGSPGWSASQFAELADGWGALGHQVALTGSPEHADLVDVVANEMEFKPIRLAEPMKVGVSAALFSEACLLVSNDRGAADLAAAVGIPRIVLVWNAEPERAVALHGRLPDVVPHFPVLAASTVLMRAIKHLEKVQQYV